MRYVRVSRLGDCNKDPFQKFRERFKRSTLKHYRGFSIEFDRQFDRRSILLELIDNSSNETVAACRLILPALGGCRGLLPMEMGDICAYVPDDRIGIGEASGFSYSTLEDGLLLLQQMAKRLPQYGVKRLYALFDPDHPVTATVYLGIARMMVVPGARVVFSGYTDTRDRPVNWSVAVADEETIESDAQGLMPPLAA